MRHFRSAAGAVAVAFLAGVTPLCAAVNNPNVQLEYLPQQTIAPARFYLRAALFDHPVQLRVGDSRSQENPAEIGWRTNDADERFTLRATNDVAAFVSGVIDEVTRDHGIQLADDAPIVLVVKLTRFRVEETNRPVGATYVAIVGLTGELRATSGEKLWSGVVTGDASRWGRKFNNTNCDEVLSDALLEAYANLLSTEELQDAWIHPQNVTSSSTPGAD
jgi:uncharacterized membrane protein (UPF0136 family)